MTRSVLDSSASPLDVHNFVRFFPNLRARLCTLEIYAS